MNIPKAREIIKDMLYRRTISLSQDQKDALGLGDEALKRCEHADRINFDGSLNLLPGETED
ncbi:hypothetical protein ES703_115627 [subsurface metagenome]